MRLRHHTIQPPPLVKQHKHGSAKQRRALRRQDRIDGPYNTVVDDAAETGGIAHIPPGRYVVSGTVFVPHNVVVESKESP